MPRRYAAQPAATSTPPVPRRAISETPGFHQCNCMDLAISMHQHKSPCISIDRSME